MERKSNFWSQMILNELNNKRRDYETRLERLRALIHQPISSILTNLSKDDFYTQYTIRDNHFAEAKILEDLLEQLNLAVNRFKNGQFGLCVKCGKRIETKRLELIPYSDMCSTCAKDV